MAAEPGVKRPVKVCMLGDSSVGKTSIVIQFYRGEFDELSEPTVGASYVTKIMETKSGDIPLHIWDTAGQERFKSVIPMYMRGSAAVILVCSVDSADSVTALDDWFDLIQETMGGQVSLYLVLNKMDLPMTIDPAAPEKWAAEHLCKF